MPTAGQTYNWEAENLFRNQINGCFTQLLNPGNQSTYILHPPQVIQNGSAWLSVNETTKQISINYKDSTGVIHAPVLIATYV
jgi:hypothetical protein